MINSGLKVFCRTKKAVKQESINLQPWRQQLPYMKVRTGW